MNKLPFLLDDYKISWWAFIYCLGTKDEPIIRKYITESKDAYYYCVHINDDPEVRKYITDSFWAYLYCRDVKVDPEVRKNISNQLLKDL